jgi:DNA-binding beta-propeller fold protein YncE
MMKMGSGSHAYEIAEGWGKLPEGVEYGYTHGVVVDSEDRVYVHNMSKDAVIVFDKEGHFITSWGEEFAAGAHGMLLNREGDQEFLYFADVARGLIVKTTLEGEVLLTLGTPDLPDVYNGEKKYVPTDVAVAPNGDIYATDGYGQSWVHQYNAQGEKIRSWGGKGSEPGKMNCPHGITIDTRGPEPLVYVADRGNHRIQIFTLDGEHVKFVTDDLDAPCSFYPFGDELYIPDLNSRVTILDKNDKLITHLGESQAFKKQGWPNLPVSERQVDKFNSPHGICVDSNRNVYVVEWISDGRLTKLIRL